MLGRVLQPDGGEPATPDPAAGGHVAAAAAVHLRRLARAAYAADHRPDGRRSDLHEPRRVRSADGPQRRTAARRTRPVRRAARPTCWRSAASTPDSRCSTPSRPTWCRWSTGSSSRLASLAERAGVDLDVHRARRRRSSPRSIRAEPSASCATSSATRSSTARATRRRHARRPTRRPSRSPCATTASGCAGRGEAGLQPVLAGRSVARPADRRHRPRPVDQPRGRAAARRLAGGVGRAGSGRPVPPRAAGALGRPAECLAAGPRAR